MTTKTTTPVTVDIETIREKIQDFAQKKDARDAAYLAFKHAPTTDSASAHTEAAYAFTQFCVDTLTEIYYLMNSRREEVTDDMIVENFESYRKCGKCNRTLLYPVDSVVDAEHPEFREANVFVRDAKGWCYSCLVDHCKTHNCNTSSCLLAKSDPPIVDPAACPFKALQDIYKAKASLR